MIRSCTLLLFVMIVFSSCKKTKEEMLCRKWQQRSFENPGRDEQDREWDSFIDTFGKNMPPEVMQESYGFTNVDSFKQSMAQIRSEFKAAEQKEIENRWLDFRKDGTVLISSGNVTDSAGWKIDSLNENRIILDEKKLQGVGSQIHLEILSLSDTALKIKFSESSSGAIATFVPVKK